MKIEASLAPDGAFIPILLKCAEFSLLNIVYFLIDTGSAISALSIRDIGDSINYNVFEKKTEAAIGIGGSLECYLINDVYLYVLTTEEKWIQLHKFDKMCLLPPSKDLRTNRTIYLPSILGRDYIGLHSELFYLKNEVYLEIN